MSRKSDSKGPAPGPRAGDVQRVHEVRTFPPLYKRTTKGAVNIWTIKVEPVSPDCGRIVVEYGMVDGKLVRQEDVITEGKNLGKKNETSPYEQAVLQAESDWKIKLDRKGYGRTAEESAVARSAMPMLAQVFDDHAGRIDWGSAFMQPKLDGHCCLATRVGDVVTLRSREGKPITKMDPVAAELLGVMEDGETFHGELYSHGMALRHISSAVKQQKEAAAHAEAVKFHVYDAMLPVKYAERHAHLRSALMGKFAHLELVKTVIVRGRGDLTVCEREFLDEGYEGGMLRHGATPYEAGKRSSSLLKVKTFKDAEFEVVDVLEGVGTHRGMAKFVCVTGDGHRFGVTAPGSHEEKRAYLDKAEEYIGRMLTVKYAYMTTTSEPVPYQPVAVDFRE